PRVYPLPLHDALPISDVVPHLQPADILVDGMRGRSSLWYRVRVNLIHVPPGIRPTQEALDADYDPWAGFEWPDRSGRLERAPRRDRKSTRLNSSHVKI